MGKYIKSNSVFTLRKKIQNLEDGSTILERDWTTLGERRKFGKGKIPIYNDGNFIFTRNNVKLPSRRSKNSSESVELRYNDVKDAKSNVNNVELNTESNDFRSFAYYGSCVDLVDKSISNIIMNFPACIGVTNKILRYPVYSSEGIIQNYENFKINGKELYVVDNSFNIDILSSEVNLGKYDNAYRYMCETYDEYEIVRNGTEKIKGFAVDYDFDDCRDNDQWYNFQKNKYAEKHNRLAPIVVTFQSEKESGELKFYGFRNGEDFLYFCEEANIIIKPVEEVIEKYFTNLRGFEKQLLTRKSNPLYQNTFITPIQTDESYVYVERNYTWPISYDYCISIDSGNFEVFYNSLMQMATVYDEIWTDNLYGRMTHEAIKNFDWSYTKDYVDGDEEDNVAGGEQMQNVIHFIGRIFDEGKQYIDGIKNVNKVTNDSYCNVPDALLSDTLENRGWDVTSVVPLLESNSENKGLIELTNDNGDLNKLVKDNNFKWFKSSNIESSNTSNYDIKFMRRLLLSSKRIFQSKGTQESIDMIMGMFGFGRKFNEGHTNDEKGDYDIKEEWYTVQPLDYKENISLIKDKITELGITSENCEEFPFLPLNLYKYKNTTLIIPYYDRNKKYQDMNEEFYFQSKGGWGYKNIEDEYCETVSYLNVVGTVNDLLRIKSIGVKSGDIYYVVDLTDAPKVFGTDVSSNEYDCNALKKEYEGYSHFFYLKENGLTTEPNNWENIKIIEEENGNIKNIDTDPMIKKAVYLDNIINSSFGNNPHVGFGNYDNGDTFIEYLKKSFKGFDDEEIIFPDFNLNQEDYSYKREEDENDKDNPFWVKDQNDRKTYNEITAKEKIDEYQVRINSKVVRLINNVGKDSDLFKQYFRKAMLPYIMQVIPSTTILILEDF